MPHIPSSSGRGNGCKSNHNSPTSSLLQNWQLSRQLHCSRDVVAIRLLSEVVARFSIRTRPATSQTFLYSPAATLAGEVAGIAKFGEYR